MQAERSVVEITGRAASCSTHMYDEFVSRVPVGRARAGKTLYFPVVQECEKGVHRWDRDPGGRQIGRRLKEPAPAVKLMYGNRTPRH
jgi:uncharacterized protein YcnI